MSLILSGTDGLSDIDGSAATPAIRGTDANTGIFFPAADTIAFSEGGAEAMRIDSAGSVGIGMTPVASYGLLQIGSAVTSAAGVTGLQSFVSATNSAVGQNGNLAIMTTNAQAADIGGSIVLGGKFVAAGTSAPFAMIAGRKENSTDNNGAGYLQFSTIPNGGSTTERMRIDSSGNVQVGTTTRSNDEKLTVFQSGSAMGISVRTTGGPTLGNYESSDNSRASYWTFGRDNASTGNFVFANNGTQRAAIDTSGNLLVGVTSVFSSGKQCIAFTGSTVQGLNIKNNADNPADTFVGFYNAFGTKVGSITAGGSTTTYNTSSDYRLKENVQPLINALDKVMALNPVSYTWKTGGEDNGFIAHELQVILPNAVSGEKDAVNEDDTINPQGVDYGKLTPILTAALQEAIAKIENLEARIAILEAK